MTIQELLSKIRPLDGVVLSSMLLVGIATTVAGVLKNPWPFSLVTYLVAGIFVIASVQYQDHRFQRLLLFGLMTGIVELITDWYHVVILQSLVYVHLSFVPVLASPEYMPLGWMNVVTQMGYLGLRLREEFNWSLPVTMIVIGVLGALNIPYYEEMAFNANAWYYTAEWMVGHTPIWVFAAYLVEIPWIVPIVMKIERVAAEETRPWSQKVMLAILLGGLLMGTVIFIGGFITHSLLNKPLI